MKKSVDPQTSRYRSSLKSAFQERYLRTFLPQTPTATSSSSTQRRTFPAVVAWDLEGSPTWKSYLEDPMRLQWMHSATCARCPLHNFSSVV